MRVPVGQNLMSIDDARRRSLLLARKICERTDEALRQRISAMTDPDYEPEEEYGISHGAWKHVTDLGIEPKSVFAHPDILCDHPMASEYYRGIALLPRKRVTDLAAGVESWEKGTRKTVAPEQALEVSRLYNLVISAIIEGTTRWTLENGYRNLIANIGIGLDGTMRNVIGQDAESLIKTRIAEWLKKNDLMKAQDDSTASFTLPNGYTMHYGPEPDIEFRHSDTSGVRVVATIEIKGGKDPAGALERLGAVRKSFENTPPGCTNFLIAGVVTAEMKQRLDEMGMVRSVFLLGDLEEDKQEWFDFLNEVFHHTVRITERKIVRR